MPLKKSKKIRSELKQFGFPDFVNLKLTERHYRLKLKKHGVVYRTGKSDLHATNSNSLNKDSRYNECTAYYIIKKGIEVTGLKYNSIGLLDIGCGNGKVLTYGMIRECKQVIGIDLDEEGLKVANSNCAQLQKNGFTTVYNNYFADASVFTIPPGINIIYIANPFGVKTMEATLNNIIRYHNTEKKDLYIIYAVAVHRDLFEQHDRCVKILERFNGSKTHPELVVFKVI